MAHLPEAVVPGLGPAVPDIFSDHALRIGKSELREFKWNAMFLKVLMVLPFIPLEASLRHGGMIAETGILAIYISIFTYGNHEPQPLRLNGQGGMTRVQP